MGKTGIESCGIFKKIIDLFDYKLDSKTMWIFYIITEQAYF